MIAAHGRLGASAYFDGVTVRLERRHRWLPSHGEREIPLGQLTAVEWKKPGLVGDGFIRFVVGGTVARRAQPIGFQQLGNAYDEWSVPFTRRQTGEFERLRDAVRAGLVNCDGRRYPPR